MGKKNKKQGKQPKQEKSEATWKGRLFTVMGLIMAAIFMPTTVLLCIGMLPTFVVLFIDRSRKKSQVLTIGAMNLAGCSMFMFELWSMGNSFEDSFNILVNPIAVVVMYSAAAAGYLIDWAMIGIVSGVLYQRSVARQKAIKKEQEDLIERWGEEVTGKLKLDEHGFVLEGEKVAM